MSRAILNGQLILSSELAVPAIDAGFVWGITVAEQLRTFEGALFQLDNHLDRLFKSVEAVGLELNFSRAQLAQQATELAAMNHALLEEGDDLVLVIFSTPGGRSAMGHCEPQLGMHTYPLPFAMWSEKYKQGESLVTCSVRQVGPDHWSPAIKCRSRMHYYLADREARAKHPKSRALLLDDGQFVCEASTANVLAVFDGEVVSPQRSKILPGISLAFVEQLASQLELEFCERDISCKELASANELLLTSTPFCIVPVTKLDGNVVGGGKPGAVFRSLSQQWSQEIGIDYQSQAHKFSNRCVDSDTHP